jgi:hypothetical protein
MNTVQHFFQIVSFVAFCPFFHFPFLKYTNTPISFTKFNIMLNKINLKLIFQPPHTKG